MIFFACLGLQITLTPLFLELKKMPNYQEGLLKKIAGVSTFLIYQYHHLQLSFAPPHMSLLAN